VVGDNIRALAEQLDPALPAVLTGHFTVSGATFGSERSVMIGRDVAVLKGVLADPRWDHVALGHIHKHQSLQSKNGYPAIVYSGSLERIDFGEEHDPKGFCWVEVAKGSTAWQFVEVKARRFQTIRIDAREADDVTMAVQAELAQVDVADAVVRVIVRLRPEQEASLRERDVRSVLRAADIVAAVQKDVERAERTRLGGDSPEGLTPLELLERYLRSKTVDEDRIRVLMEHAQKLIGQG
jgi:exonuclease SbcD